MDWRELNSGKTAQPSPQRGGDPRGLGQRHSKRAGE